VKHCLNYLSNCTCLSPCFRTAEAAESTKAIYEATGVVNCKVTHHRTAALQYAGFEGLIAEQVNTLTNHLLETQHAAYHSQAEWVVSWTLRISFVSTLYYGPA
jgi:hypothetical protein